MFLKQNLCSGLKYVLLAVATFTTSKSEYKWHIIVHFSMVVIHTSILSKLVCNNHQRHLK